MGDLLVSSLVFWQLAPAWWAWRRSSRSSRLPRNSLSCTGGDGLNLSPYIYYNVKNLFLIEESPHRSLSLIPTCWSAVVDHRPSPLVNIAHWPSWRRKQENSPPGGLVRRREEQWECLQV